MGNNGQPSVGSIEKTTIVDYYLLSTVRAYIHFFQTIWEWLTIDTLRFTMEVVFLLLHFLASKSRKLLNFTS